MTLAVPCWSNMTQEKPQVVDRYDLCDNIDIFSVVCHHGRGVTTALRLGPTTIEVSYLDIAWAYTVVVLGEDVLVPRPVLEGGLDIVLTRKDTYQAFFLVAK